MSPLQSSCIRDIAFTYQGHRDLTLKKCSKESSLQYSVLRVEENESSTPLRRYGRLPRGTPPHIGMISIIFKIASELPYRSVDVETEQGRLAAQNENGNGFLVVVNAAVLIGYE